MTVMSPAPVETASRSGPVLASPAIRRRPWQRALIVLFLVSLVAPPLDLALRLDPNPSPLKLDVPFPRPHLGRSLLKWPGDLKWYLQSNMGFRATLVRLHGRLIWSLHRKPW